MKNLRIGIVGTRGIPNCYGGFEQLAEYLSAGLVKTGHDVIVYNTHNHPYKEHEWKGVSIVHCYNPKTVIGTAGQFIYDLNCVLDARRRNFDVLLVLGYTSISMWAWLFPKCSAVIFNMDGLEWKRAKYSRPVRKFLSYAEKIAAEHRDNYISDSPVIASYLKDKYRISSRFIPYGADIYSNEDEAVLNLYRVTPNNYYLLIARIEPENNIEMILDGFSKSNSDKKFIVIGNATNKFGKYLIKKFAKDKRIEFAGIMFNKQIKHSLCCFSALYFHGHSTGGTNPSLLEAMASRALIAAHGNAFNRQILTDHAFYFNDSHDIKELIDNDCVAQLKISMAENNLKKIESHYRWESIVDQYEKFILECYQNKNAVERDIYNRRESYQ